MCHVEGRIHGCTYKTTATIIIVTNKKKTAYFSGNNGSTVKDLNLRKIISP